MTIWLIFNFVFLLGDSRGRRRENGGRSPIGDGDPGRRQGASVSLHSPARYGRWRMD